MLSGFDFANLSKKKKTLWKYSHNNTIFFSNRYSYVLAKMSIPCDVELTFQTWINI